MIIHLVLQENFSLVNYLLEQGASVDLGLSKSNGEKAIHITMQDTSLPKDLSDIVPVCLSIIIIIQFGFYFSIELCINVFT